MGRTKYNEDSLARALSVHLRNGIVEAWHPPEPGSTKWLVYCRGQGTAMEFTAAQVYAFCVGCTETTRTWNRRFAPGRVVPEQFGVVRLPDGGETVGQEVPA